MITLETAKLAKEKGFNWEPLHIYDLSENPPILNLYGEVTGDCELYAPTQSLLQKWLREVHNIYVVSRPSNTDDSLNKSKFVAEIYFEHKIKGLYGEHNVCDYFSTYEEALEKGLQEGLTLIKN